MESIGAGGILALKYCSAGKAATAVGFAITAPDVVHDSTRPLFDTARNMSEQMVNSVMQMKPVVAEATNEHAHVGLVQEPSEHTVNSVMQMKPVVEEATGEHTQVGLAQEPLPETDPLAKTMPDHKPILAQEPLPDTDQLAKTTPDHKPVQESNFGVLSSILLSNTSPVLLRYDRFGATSGVEGATSTNQASSKILKGMVSNAPCGLQKDSQLGDTETTMQRSDAVKGHASNQTALHAKGSTMRAAAGSKPVDAVAADRNLGFIFVRDRLECVSAIGLVGEPHHRARRRCCFDVTRRV